MTTEDILQLRNRGEVSKVQFKERILDKYDIGCELVAMSNFRGGQLVVGINDKTGEFNPLSYAEVQETTNLLGNIASENVVPSILLDIDTASVEGGSVVVATIKEGNNKPYHDNKGIVWIKNGADKRKVFDNAELAEMMSECGSFAPDEAVVKDATLDDLDEDTLKIFLQNRFSIVLEKKGIVGDVLREASLDEISNAIAKGHNLNKLMRNLRFIRPDGGLTVAAMLLFGKYPQRWLPVMTAKCICFVGNNIGGKQFRDKVNDADMRVICCISLKPLCLSLPVILETYRWRKSLIHWANLKFHTAVWLSLWSTPLSIVHSTGMRPSVSSSLTTVLRYIVRAYCRMVYRWKTLPMAHPCLVTISFSAMPFTSYPIQEQAQASNVLWKMDCR